MHQLYHRHIPEFSDPQFRIKIRKESPTGKPDYPKSLKKKKIEYADALGK